ncbi:hypothetical protein [Rhodopirellula halodulae]|uniref:hypothetical protein n=1 Tax=Rhodopirellula halodulae TaxID=2894198 RepID=UPI001E2A1E6B|nr:hypothetical protein [Rhodopirellula sp. JC737]MCC9656945.1 hypothetical protein [Rhodopirellula sp. JC737]
METEILLWCVITPAIISLAFVIGAWRASRWDGEWIGHRLPASLCVVGWSAAVVASLVARQDLDFDSLESWQMALVPVVLGSLLIAVLSPTKDSFASEQTHGHSITALIAGLAGVATAMWSMPTGDGWVDMLPLHRPWMAAVAAAAMINLWALNRMQHAGATAWMMWVALAGLFAPTLLAASAYGGFAEWLVSALVATTVFAIGCSGLSLASFAKLTPAVVLLSASATATGRFYTYEDHPAWLYSVILLSPCIITVADIPLRERSTKVRVLVAVLVTVVLLVLVAWYLFSDSLFGDPAEEW